MIKNNKQIIMIQYTYEVNTVLIYGLFGNPDIFSISFAGMRSVEFALSKMICFLGIAPYPLCGLIFTITCSPS